MNITDKRPVIKKKDYDVVVVGGGIAGVAAAVSASRCNKKTLIIEKAIAFGGLATMGLINWYEPLCDTNGKKMMGGICEELIRLACSESFNSLPDEWKENTDFVEGKIYAAKYSNNMFVMQLDEYLKKNNVDIILDTLATFPVMEGNTVTGVVCETKEGKVHYGCKVIIDASGDADIINRAGVPTVDGDNWLSFIAQCIKRDFIKEYFEKNENANVLIKNQAAGSGTWGKGQPEGQPKLKGLSAEDVTEMSLKGRALFLEKLRELDEKDRIVTQLPTVAQFRTTRRIKGEYEFSGKEDGEKFYDAIGSFGDWRARLNIGVPVSHFQLPYRTLYNKDFPNILAAGRIVSAYDDGWELTRVIPVCALTGEAAGYAASISIDDNVDVCDVSIDKLQTLLKENNNPII